MLPPHPLHSLFGARHIAVIGASQRSETLGGRVFASMLNHPFQGRLTPVNLRHPTVAGLQAYAQISQIDDKPDAAVAVCHASAHPGIAAACIRLRIPHLLCIADDGGYDGESLARLQKAAASGRTQITLCSADGFNLPAQNLYANAYSHAPEAGKIAVVGFTAGFCSDVMQYLRDSSAGYSFTINLTGQLATPLPWLDWFREDAGSHILIVQYPAQPDAAFFSTLRQAAQRKNVILYTGRSMCGREKQIARHLAERSGALPAFTPDELCAAVWAAQMPRKLRSGSLHVLSDSEAGWLCDTAEESGLKVHRLPAVSRHSNALVWRDTAAAALQQENCRALLVQTDGGRDTVSQLMQLQQQSETPLYLVSPFSDGLFGFPNPQQALAAVAAQNSWQQLRRRQQTAAKPPHFPPVPPNLPQARQYAGNGRDFLAVLHLPPQEGQNLFSDGLLTYTVEPHYGAVLHAECGSRQTVLLPPFDTADARRLCRLFGQRKLAAALEQVLYSFNHTAYRLLPLRAVRIGVDSENAVMQTRDFVWNEDEGGADQSLPLLPEAPFSDGRFFSARNGEILLIRHLLPEDADALQQFVRSLSDADRKSRFMNAVKEFSAAQLAQFSRTDYTRETALAACSGSGEIVGWAQYGCLRFPGACEFSITVSESMKGQGLAVRLMEELIACAKKQGYRSMCAEILAENTAMLGLAAKLGFHSEPSAEDKQLFTSVLTWQKENRRRLPK